MKTINIFQLGVIILLLLAVGSCKEDKEEFDIDWPVPEITSVSPQTQMIGEELTISGNEFTKITRIWVGGTEVAQADIVSITPTQIVVRVPRITNTGPIELQNVYERRAESSENFQPQFPKTLVTSWPSVIYRGQNFTLGGENVDLITKVQLGSTSINVDGTKGTATSLPVSTASVDLSAVDQVSITVTSAKGGLEGTTTSMSIPVEDLPEFFDPVDPVVLFDFENGIDPFQNVQNGASHSLDGGTGISKGRGEHYLTIKKAATPGWTDFGFIEIPTAIDLSNFHTPYFSFLVNTNGKAGYFQLEDSQGNWYHFTQDPDDYKFVTDGWEWRSYNLNEVLDGQPLDLANFKARLTFKSGNVGNGAPEDYEINIDQIMITDGKVAPVYKLWNFEEGTEVPFVSAAAAPTHGFNAGGVPPFAGNRYYTVRKNAANGWTDLGTFDFGQTLDLSNLKDPHFNFWVNSNESGGGYFQLDDGQGSWLHFTPGSTGDDYKFVTDGWELRSIRLETAPWEGAGFNPSVFKPVLTVKTGNVGNSGVPENFELNIDEIYISDGPMF